MAQVERQEQLITGYTGRISLVLALGWLATLLGRQAIPPLLPAISRTLGLSSVQAGFALTVMLGLNALVQYPSGRLSDELSRKSVLVVSLTLTAVGFGLLASSITYLLFLLGVCLVGIGGGGYFSPSRAYLSDLFVEKLGQVYGLQSASGMTGSMLASGLAVAAVAGGTWRTAFLPAALLCCLTAALVHVISRQTYAFTNVRLDIRQTGTRLAGTGSVRRLLVVRILVAFVVQGFLGFLPTFLQVEKGFSALLASLGFGLVYFIALFSSPCAGALSDRTSRPAVLTATLLVGGGGLLGLLLADGVVFVFLAIGVTAIGMMSCFPVVQALFMSLLGQESRGGDLGALKTVYSGIGSLGPLYAGSVATVWGYVPAFASFAVCLLASGLVAFRTR